MVRLEVCCFRFKRSTETQKAKTHPGEEGEEEEEEEVEEEAEVEEVEEAEEAEQHAAVERTDG